MALGIDGVRVGCWTDSANHTGTTVILPPTGTLGAAVVRGGAPGTREVAALGATGSIDVCHAVVLSGGSAFGLATADGAMAWCESHGIGHDKAVARIPIVGAAILFDLRQPGTARPGREAGWSACEAAHAGDPPMGSVGVGTGCSVGKTAGLAHASNSGQGWAVAAGGGVTVGALVAANPVGDVLDERGEVLAGSRAPPDQPRYPRTRPPASTPVVGDAPEERGDASERRSSGPPDATVLGCLATDARLSKPDAVRAADLAHSGVARAVSPAHTSLDGDALFLLCAQRTPADMDLVADLGAQAVAAAIRQAVRHATGIPGFPADPRAGG